MTIESILQEFHEKFGCGHFADEPCGCSGSLQITKAQEDFLRSSLTQLESQTREEAYKKVNRVEVIDHTKDAPEGGRVYVKWDDNIKVEPSFQDNDRTLKIFISLKA